MGFFYFYLFFYTKGSDKMKGKRKWKEVTQTYINDFLFSVKQFSYVRENEENEGLDVLFFYTKWTDERKGRESERKRNEGI